MSNLNKTATVPRKRLFEEVAAKLKQAMYNGEYRVGDKLPAEQELATMFGVSRIVVREAVRYLELSGLVAIKQGATGGAFVTEISSATLQGFMKDLLLFGNLSIRQLTEVRSHIDPEISRLAAIRATKEDISALARTLEIERSGVPGPGYMENNANFHRLLGRATKNLFYSVIADSLADLIIEFLKTVKSPAVVIHDPHDHEEIYAAIIDRDPDRAFKATQEHIINFSAEILKQEKKFIKNSVSQN